MPPLPTLRLLPGAYAVCRLDASARAPDLPSVTDGDLFVVARAPGELSVVCREEIRPSEAEAEIGFRALGVIGPLDFALVGILAGITATLAAAEVSVFAVSTFDTDYLLLRERSLERAVAALRGAGYELEA